MEDQKAAIRVVIEEGIAAGRGPRQTALDIVGRVGASGVREGGIVGLNEPQTRAWLRAGEELDNLDGAYFTRKLRDKRFDRLVSKAIKDGKPLSKADRDRILARYSDRLLKLRGDTIARTETIASFNAGREQGMRQLIDDGSVDAGAVTKVWDATLDSRTRTGHAAMEAQQRSLDEPFTTPAGHRLRFPGDTGLGAPASETVSCRCILRFSLDFMRGLK